MEIIKTFIDSPHLAIVPVWGLLLILYSIIKRIRYWIEINRYQKIDCEIKKYLTKEEFAFIMGMENMYLK